MLTLLLNVLVGTSLLPGEVPCPLAPCPDPVGYPSF